MIGSIQAMEVVKILLDFQELLVNSFLSYDGINMAFKKIKVEQNEDCTTCGKTVLVKSRR